MLSTYGPNRSTQPAQPQCRAVNSCMHARPHLLDVLVELGHLGVHVLHLVLLALVHEPQEVSQDLGAASQAEPVAVTGAAAASTLAPAASARLGAPHLRLQRCLVRLQHCVPRLQRRSRLPEHLAAQQLGDRGAGRRVRVQQRQGERGFLGLRTGGMAGWAWW